MTAILSVVRGLYVDPTDKELRDEWGAEHIKYHNDAVAGAYIKSGGRDATDNLQEAQIFGWSRKAKENLTRYTVPFYEVLPIRVEIA